MTNIGVWIEKSANQPVAEAKRALKASGCTNFHPVKGPATTGLRQVLDTLQAGDRITVVSLTELEARSADFVDVLAALHQAGVEFCSLDGLSLPTGKVGEQILQWLAAVETMRSVARSNAVKSGIAKGAPRKRKVSEKEIASFLSDAQKMSQGALAKKYGISITTVRKYLVEWQAAK